MLRAIRAAMRSAVLAGTVVGSILSLAAGPVVSAAGGAAAAVPASYPLGHFAVGTVTQTFTDSSRPTAAWGAQPEEPARTLVTTILYPAEGAPLSSTTPVASAPPDRSGAPYPLIVFSHGLGASPQDYLPLLERWASAGFVVAAPRFPLTSSATPGGPDAGDVVNQPKDVSFVIGSMLAGGDLPILTGLVDPDEVGVAGHSNGAVTTLGLIANTCCHDPRVKAAVVMAGTTVGIPGGVPDYTDTPPLLLVHGTDDQLIPYRSAPIVYDEVPGPKGLLTISGGSHESAAGLVAPSSTSVIRTTTDFFDVYLKGDRAALGAMKVDGHSPTTSLVFDAVAGSRGTPVPIPPAPVVHLRASVTPDRGLTDGQAVVVRWSGYSAGKVVNILECYHVDIAAAAASNCDFSNAQILHPDPTGSGSLTFHVVTGPVGTGTCGPGVQGCAIVVNNSSSTLASESRVIPIAFGD